MTLLKHVAEVRVSNVDKKSYDGEKSVRLCNYTDVYYGDVLTALSNDYMQATASAEQIRNFRLRAGDTVLTKDSETAEDIGVSAFIEESADDLVCGYHLAIIRPHPEKVDPKYLSWCLRSIAARGQLSTVATGVTRFGLRTDALVNMTFEVSTQDSQRRISDFLDHQVHLIDSAINLRHEQRRLTTGRQIAFSRQATTTGSQITESKATGIPWMPSMAQDWKLLKISRNFSVSSGTTPRSNKPLYFDGGIPWVNTGDLRDRDVAMTRRALSQKALDDYSTLKIYQPGALIVAMYGATVGRLGRLVVPACVNQACSVLSSSGAVLSDYAFYWFLSHRSEITKLASGGGQPNISAEIIKRLMIPTPSIEQQNQIIVRLQELDAIIEQTNKLAKIQIALLEERKQALITAAVTGQLDVTTARSGLGVDVP